MTLKGRLIMLMSIIDERLARIFLLETPLKSACLKSRNLPELAEMIQKFDAYFLKNFNKLSDDRDGAACVRKEAIFSRELCDYYLTWLSPVDGSLRMKEVDGKEVRKLALNYRLILDKIIDFGGAKMNPTENKITFFSHEDFVSFIEKYGSERYGRDKNDFSFDWLGLPNDQLLEGSFEGGKSSLINAEENSISFVTKWRPALFVFQRMEDLEIDFKFYALGKNGEGVQGFVKNKKYYLEKVFDEVLEEGCEPFGATNEKCSKRLHELEIKINKRLMKKAAVKTTLKKATGEYGIISEFSEGCIKVCVPEMQIDEPVPSEFLIAEYENIEELVADGWAIDPYDSKILSDLNPHTESDTAAILLP